MNPVIVASERMPKSCAEATGSKLTNQLAVSPSVM